MMQMRGNSLVDQLRNLDSDVNEFGISLGNVQGLRQASDRLRRILNDFQRSVDSSGIGTPDGRLWPCSVVA